MHTVIGAALGTGAGYAKGLFETAPIALKMAKTPEHDYAETLAILIWQEFYKVDAPEWEPCDDLMGILSQIDNMVSGLSRSEKAND